VHLFNPRPLAEKLRDDVLGERDKFHYILASLMLQLAGGALGLLTASALSAKAVLSLGVFALILVLGSRACFATNVRGDNRRFVERWLCLSVPLSFWFLLVPHALDAAFYFYAGRLIRTPFGPALRLLLPFFSLWIWARLALFYVALNHFIRIAASGSAAHEAANFAPLASP